jgi:hypothetical protein
MTVTDLPAPSTHAMSTSTSPKSSPDHCAHQFFNKAVRTMHMRRNAPPPIPIPINPIRRDVRVASPPRETLPMVAVEISNYPPSLSRRDLHTIFKGFAIALDFSLPTEPRFAYPLRTFVWVTGKEEADRAVKELSGTVVGGRRIRVTLLDPASYEQKEVVVAEMSDELKIAIISMWSLKLRNARSANDSRHRTCVLSSSRDKGSRGPRAH